VPATTNIPPPTRPSRPLADAGGHERLAFGLMHFMRWF
jgi:hypothetical protein